MTFKVKTKGQNEGEKLLEPKLRFKEFDDGYIKYKLSEVVDFYKGNILSKSDIIEGGKTPCILYGELYTKYSEITYKIFSFTNNSNSNLFYSKKNDILIPCSGETALDISTSTCVLLNNIAIGGDLNVLRPKKQNGKYLSYLLSHKKRIEIAKYAQGDSIVHLYADKIRNINVYLPSYIEQEKIANLLSLLDKKIELQKRKIDALKIYKRGLLYKIFNKNTPNFKIKDILILGKSGGTPKSTNPTYYNGKIPFLSITDMTSQGKYIKQTEKHISYEGLNNSSAWLLPINTLILSMYASYGLVSINKIELSTSQAMFNMILKEDINIEYIYYYLNYLREIHFYDELVSTGTQSNLNADKVKNIPIYLPAKSEQDMISTLFNTFDKKIELEENDLNNLTMFKKSLLQQMFI